MSFRKTLRESIPKPIAILPNICGFEFKGITFDDKIVDCFVRKSLEGQHVILNKYTKEDMFQKLKGWIR